MTHLGERITDFVFGEMSAAELEDARRHIAACADCRKQVEQFEATRALLQMSPDVEPPRHVVFEVEKRRRAEFWRWLVPAGVAAAILLAVLLALPLQIQWNQSQLTIAFGRPPLSPPLPSVAASPPVAAPAAPAALIDYASIARQVQATQQPWLLSEMAKRDAAQAREIQRLRDHLVYVEAQQHVADRQNIENASNIQLLAQKSGAQD